MATKSGVRIIRVAELEWLDSPYAGWTSRRKLYLEDPDHELTIRLVQFPVGKTEPRHVHPGTHAATMMASRSSRVNSRRSSASTW